MNEGLVRVFFAVWPDAVTREAISALAADIATGAAGKAPGSANIHLTLAFIGDVRTMQVGALQAIGAEAAGATPPFTLVLDRLGGFRDAGIAWLGTTAPPPELDALVGRMRAALGAAGFPIDRRPFRVHVTLARRCRARARGAAIAPLTWRVDRMTLTASELGGAGSRYRDLAAWSLGAAPSSTP